MLDALLEMDDLRQEWTTLYAKTLPQLAKAKDPAQPKWPVTLDHCFARIILDNTVGNGEQQWDKVISKPAVRHMDERQLQNAIDLGVKITTGKVDLCELDKTSLLCRGKNEAKYKHEAGNVQPAAPSGKRKRDDVQSTDLACSSPKKSKKAAEQQSTLSFWKAQTSVSESTSPISEKKSTSQSDGQLSSQDFKRILNQIQSHPKLTTYRKRLYTILLSVPRGRWTTYAKMSDHLKSSARAVGSGMRNNPFAPEVPCHRVLAADGSIGGFHGDWGKDGKHAARKIELLRSEGVSFDGKGKVVGEPFRKFHEFEDLEEDVPK